MLSEINVVFCLHKKKEDIEAVMLLSVRAVKVLVQQCVNSKLVAKETKIDMDYQKGELNQRKSVIVQQ